MFEVVAFRVVSENILDAKLRGMAQVVSAQKLGPESLWKCFMGFLTKG
jgi:hypothetical protein